jgi:hypothetical protein
MNGDLFRGDQRLTQPIGRGVEIPERGPLRTISMINGVMAFVAVSGAVSLICYRLMDRTAQARRPRRESAGGDASNIGPSDSSSSSGWSLFSWSGGDGSSSHDSGFSSDSGGDSGGGGGDGGGGGGGD